MILFLTFRYHQQHFGSRSSFACGSPFNELEDVRKPLRELSLILPDTREPSTPLLEMIMLVVVWMVVVVVVVLMNMIVLVLVHLCMDHLADILEVRAPLDF